MGHSINFKVQSKVYPSTPNNLECCFTMPEMLRPKKKAKIDHLSAITIGYLHGRQGSYIPEELRRLKILFDIGRIASLLQHSLVGKLKQKVKILSLNKKARGFKTTQTCKINFTLLAFHEKRNIC